MTGLPTLAPVISVQPLLCSDSPGRDIVEGCLLTPGTRPNSLLPSRLSTTVAVTNGCDNTPLGDPGRAYGQPEKLAASIPDDIFSPIRPIVPSDMEKLPFSGDLPILSTANVVVHIMFVDRH